MNAVVISTAGMIKAPPLTTFNFPTRGLFSIALVFAVNIIFFKPSPWTELANSIVDNVPGGTTAVTAIWSILTAVHALEGLYAAYLCRRHSAGVVLGVSAFSMYSSSVC